MTLFKDKFKIDSNRLKNWDYSSEALYFITIVTKNRKCIFGSVEDNKMVLNKNGQIIENELLRSITIRNNWFFHNWIVMPNHIHLLIEIQAKSHIVETHRSASTSSISTNVETIVPKTHCGASLQYQSGSKLSRKTDSIASFVAIFKSVTTKQINGLESIWQTNYHDHIIRNYKRFEIIYDYIKNNPLTWETDSINSNFK